ncbi:MAG TPA: SUMF1/EgtB/PvdO family nonheme iron enzyme, partial [Methylibium sp.]
RRLPTEPEWELAACTLASRGFRHGEVWEWTASAARPYPGFMPGPWREHSLAHFGAADHLVLRGGSFATRERIKHPRFRAFAAPVRDDLFSGFRSCAL